MGDRKKRFTKNEFRVLLLLTDGEKWSERDIREKLDFNKPDVSKIVVKLLKDGILERDYRKSTKPDSRNPNQPETANYIKVDIKIYYLIFRDIRIDIKKIVALHAQHEEESEYLSNLSDDERLKYSCEENMIEVIEESYWESLYNLVHSNYTRQIINKYGSFEVGKILLSLGEDDAIWLMKGLVKVGTINKEDYSNFLDFIDGTGMYAQSRLTLEELEEIHGSKDIAELIYGLTTNDRRAA